MAGLSGVMGTMAMSSWGMPIVVGILVGVLIGALAGVANGLLISPVVFHRVLFRQHARPTVVSAGQRFALAGFATLGLTVVGVCALIVDVVLGLVPGVVAAVVALVVFTVLWGIWPMVLRRRAAEEEDEV